MYLPKPPSDAVVIRGLRWSIVLIFALFGIAKFAAYEAAGVATIAGKHPFFSWMYPLWGERGASNAIGTIELLAGAMIALGAWSARAGFVGGAMGVATFLITISFSFGAPAFWEAGLRRAVHRIDRTIPHQGHCAAGGVFRDRCGWSAPVASGRIA